MQSLSKSDEQKLLDGVKQAVDLVDNQGMTPNTAMKKVAEEFKYSPGFLKAACNAFNNGRQLAQWKANDNVLDKLASFPLADYETIHDEMWGSSQEKVASASAFSPRFESYEDQARNELLNMDLSSFEKAASDEKPEVHPMAADEQAEMRAKRAYDAFEYRRRELEEARREKTANEDRLYLKMHLLENYFKKFAYDRLPLAQVEHGVAAYFGQPGKSLMQYVAERFPREKRASDHQPTWEGFKQPVNRNQEPYTLVADCIKQAQELHKANAALKVAEEKLAAAKEGVAPFLQPRPGDQNGSQPILTPSLLPEEPGQKQAASSEQQQTDKEASIFGGIAGGMGLGAGKGLMEGMTGDPRKQLESQIGELESPDHLNELRKIRAQTVLTQLMSDPDNPLSGYDPEEVLTAYNELVQLSPRLADQPSAIAPLLNKRLMGNTEPFEVGEQLKLEEGLKKVQAPQSEPVDLMKNEASILS